MRFRHIFAVGFGWRLLLLLAAVAAFALSLWQPGLAAARLVTAALVVGAVWSLWHFIGRTNREVARFVEALRYGDFNQGFGRVGGGGFDELGEALGDAMRQLRAERAQAGDEARVHAALADESPSALLLIDQDERVTLANKAARKTFCQLAGTRIDDFAPYGTELVAMLRDGAPGGRTVMPLRIDDVVQRAMVSRASLDRVGRTLAIVAVQPIQQELSSVELAAQADLVRVLTHEIMNSMTPVVSLAESAARLMRTVDAGGNPAVEDARLAIDTLARRASGIMHFVEILPRIQPRAGAGAAALRRRAMGRGIEAIVRGVGCGRRRVARCRGRAGRRDDRRRSRFARPSRDQPDQERSGSRQRPRRQSPCHARYRPVAWWADYDQDQR